MDAQAFMMNSRTLFTRRQFLKTGVVGGLFLAGLSGTHGVLWGKASQPLASAGLHFITTSDNMLLEKLIPVVLKGASSHNTAPSVSEVVSGIDFTITRLSLHTQQEIRQLFILLQFAPSRLLTTSIWSWEHATEAEVESFLENWRTHRFALFRTAYFALVKLIMGAYYALPSAWSRIGYSGPPRLR